jgi:hypothetical protein
MKKLFTTILTAMIAASTAFAQSPQKMSYQAVIRDADDNLVKNEQVGMQISILKGSVNGQAVYRETHAPNTNENGLVTLQIGEGSVVFGSMSNIDWSDGPFYIKTETDPEGSSNYTLTITSQLLSVPYAFYAETADSLSGGVKETDPVFASSIASDITGMDTTNWNNKLGNYTETDPVFNNSVAVGITGNDTTAWNNKLDMVTGSESAFDGWDKDVSDDFSGNYADLTNTPDLSDTANYLMSESDPVFNNSVAGGINENDTMYWNNKLDNYTETQNLSDVLIEGNTASGDRIKNLGDPVNNKDAANKEYADGVVTHPMVITSSSTDISITNQESQTVKVDAGVTITLPSNPANGQKIHLISYSASATIDPNGNGFRDGSDYYTGSTTFTFTDLGSSSSTGGGLTIIFDGVLWMVVGKGID